MKGAPEVVRKFCTRMLKSTDTANKDVEELNKEVIEEKVDQAI